MNFFQGLRRYLIDQKPVQTNQGYQSHPLPADLDTYRRKTIPLKKYDIRACQSLHPKKKKKNDGEIPNFLLKSILVQHMRTNVLSPEVTIVNNFDPAC